MAMELISLKRINSHRYRFLSGFDWMAVEYELYCYPWLPCHTKRIRVALISLRKKKAAITGGEIQSSRWVIR